MDHKTVTLDGVNLHYIQVGQGPVVLLLHGLGASLVTWSQNIQPLAESGFTVIAPDLPGHGDSDKPDTLSYDPLAGTELIGQFLDGLGVERASVVGNSAGGLVGALFALDHPEAVERLVLVASAGLGRRVSWLLRLISLPVLGEMIYGPWLNKRMGAARWIFHRPPPFLDELLTEMRRVRSFPGARQAALRSLRSSVNYRGLKEHLYILHRLHELMVPLLTVWGENDLIIPVSHARSVRHALPQSLVHTIPQCGHWPHMEKAEEFNSLLNQFLAGALDGQRWSRP